MIDIPGQLKAIKREVTRRPSAGGEGGEDVCVLFRRDYSAPIEDVWDALTDPDRMKRWFLPVSGDLRVGGKFQLEGNAGGEILVCEPPRLLKVTFGAPNSLVELRLSADGDDDTILELEHTVPIEMAGSGAGALYVGPGWDAAFMALDLFLDSRSDVDPLAVPNSPQGREFSKQSVHTWSAVVETSGTANPDELASATEVSLAQFASDTDESQEDGDGK